jgi:hypothetical protein
VTPTKRKRVSCSAISIVIALFFMSVRSSDGAEPAEVEKLIRQANDYRRVGKEALAFPLLQKAHALARTPRTSAQLGLVEFNLGYWLEAEAHLAGSLAVQQDVWVHQNRGALESTLARARERIAEVTVTGTPEGGDVLLNGRSAGRLPLAGPVRVAEGAAMLEVRAPGHQTAQRSLTLVGARREEISIKLEPAPAAVVEPPRAAPAPVAARESARMSDVKGTSMARPLAWAGTAAASAAAAFAIYETVTWRSKIHEFENHLSPVTGPMPRFKDCGVDESQKGGPGCDVIHSDLIKAKQLAIVGYAAAGALAAGAITMFVLSGDTNESVALACVPSLGAFGAACRLRY